MLDRHEVKVHVDQQLLVARATMLPRVQNAFDRLLEERGLLSSDPAPYFSPLGHPVWVAGRLDDEGIETPSEVLSNVLGVSVLGYLRARAQDDWLDGCAADDPRLIAVGEALLPRCN